MDYLTKEHWDSIWEAIHEEKEERREDRRFLQSQIDKLKFGTKRDDYNKAIDDVLDELYGSQRVYFQMLPDEKCQHKAQALEEFAKRVEALRK